MSDPNDLATPLRKRGLLELIEQIGNRLPDPVTLFVIGALSVLVFSHIAQVSGWQVKNPTTGQMEKAKSLLATPSTVVEEDGTPHPEKVEGLRWVWLNLVKNFTGFAPLGVVLVGMIGIGLAERTGLIGTLLKGMVLIMPSGLMTPAVVFVGVMSSMALDAGYIVLPPLAAAVFMKSGRSPVVGLAAVFAGVAAGFSANLLITGLDPLLQSFTETAANILDPNYKVDIRCNYYFMIASTILITLVGWAVTRYIVEPRYSQQEIGQQIAAWHEAEGDEDGETAASQPAQKEQAAKEEREEESSDRMTPTELRGLGAALAALVVAGGLVLWMIVGNNGALSGFTEPRPGWKLDVWVQAIVPILFFLFLVPGLAYGIATGSIKNDRDMATMMGKTMASMGPYIVLAFFAGQFVSWFDHSNLGKLIALKGVEVLQAMNMPAFLLVIAIVLLSAVLNLFVGSASAKWALISTVFVPIFAGVGVSPELTQAAYRVGDSVTNSITPLNPYMVIILVFVKKYVPEAGLGSLISLMLPYTLAFTAAWILLLMVWMLTGLPLGPGHLRLFIEPLGAAAP